MPEPTSDFIASAFIDGRVKGLFVDNEFVPAAGAELLTATDPATQNTIGEVSIAQQSDVDRAVARARAALEDGPWARMRPSDRGQLLWRLGDLVERHQDELALLETLNNG